PDGHLLLYGFLLGACGDKDDAAFLKRAIVLNRHGLDMEGVVAGYLLLAGEEGLAHIEETMIKSDDADLFGADNALSAIRFVWEHGNGKIPKERLRKSMSLFFERPSRAASVVRDLTRLKEWEMQDRIVALYHPKHNPN